jgi:hypothetical protein
MKFKKALTPALFHRMGEEEVVPAFGFIHRMLTATVLHGRLQSRSVL